MKKMILAKNFLGLCLVLGTVNFAFAEDAEVKLNSNNGSTKLVVQDSTSLTVFSADSDGNTVINGTAAVTGSAFSVGGSTLVVKAGNVGIGTNSPAALLEVNGAASFGAGLAKSTFTAAGALVLVSNQNLTLFGAGKATGLAAPTAGSDAATKLYVDAATSEAGEGACPADMAYIPGVYPYCVDKYEAYLVSGSVSNDTCTNGSQAEVDANGTTAIAGSAAGQTPLVSINWCAAKKACQNAGKHLLTNMEWFTAANYKGSKWNITDEQTGWPMDCNTNTVGAAPTGASADCVTQEGVYDMIGNVWERVDFVMTADPTNGLASNYVTGYDFATGIPTSTGVAPNNAFGGDHYNAYNGAGAARVLLRGGSWVYGAAAGVFTFYANYSPSIAFDYIGFRCGRRK